MNPLGFTTTDGGQIRRVRTTQVIDNSGGKYVNTAQWFANYFGVPVTPGTAPTLAAGAPAAASGVTVILGQDEENAFNALSPDVEQSGDGGTGTLGYYSNRYRSGNTNYSSAQPCYAPSCKSRP